MKEFAWYFPETDEIWLQRGEDNCCWLIDADNCRVYFGIPTGVILLFLGEV